MSMSHTQSTQNNAASSSSSTSSSSSAQVPTRVPYTPSTYSATKTEVGVFTTPPYSGAVKPLWRFKDARAARESAEGIWRLFEDYRDKGDFVGMDISRKFIQMGRTRSLRYALRQSGRKYDPSTGREMERTGQVYDREKLEGAGMFERALERVWADEQYKRAWEGWGGAAGVRGGKGREKKKRTREDQEEQKEEDEEEEEIEPAEEKPRAQDQKQKHTSKGGRSKEGPYADGPTSTRTRAPARAKRTKRPSPPSVSPSASPERARDPPPRTKRRR